MKKVFLFVLFFCTLLISNSFAEFTFVQTKEVDDDTPGIRGINFKPDGTRMYITSRENNPNARKAYMIEYSLSKPFDISTATISFSGGSPKGTPLDCDGAGGDDQMELPHAIEFKPDGTRMFITSNQNFSGNPDVAVYQFKLTTPWDSTTLVCEKIYEVDVDGGGDENQVRTLDFNPDGTRMFVGGRDEDKIRQFDLATPFDLRSGVTPGGISDSLASADEEMRNIQFNPDGTQLFVAGDENARMNLYSLSTAYDITTLSSTFTTFDLGSRVDEMRGFIFASNFTKLFVTSDDSSDNKIHEYHIDCAGTITCADPSANADVKAIIEANVESAKRIIRNNTLPIFHRTEWLRRHKNKDNLNNLNAEIDFTNEKIARLVSALETLKKDKDRTYSSNDWFQWSEGRVSLGRKSAKSGSSRDIHGYGISVGADRIKEEDRDEMYGYVFQYGNDDVDIGNKGTNLSTDTYSIAMYSTKFKDNESFTDSIIGFSLLDINHRRVINNNTLKGDRAGQQIFGSINFGKRLHDEKLNLSPGIKLDLGYTKLREFKEKTTLGDSLADALIYKDQNIKTALATIGFLFDTENEQEERTTNHHGRIEYVGDFSPSSNAEFIYRNDQGTGYNYSTNNKSKHNYRIGYGFDITSISGWSVVTNFERFGASGKGFYNEIYLLIGYVPIDDMKFSFEIDNSNTTSLGFVNKINNYNFKINSNFDFLSEEKNHNTMISVSNKF
jgi:outer membrane autotransporter protein